MKPTGTVIYWRDPEIKGFEICKVIKSGHVFPDLAHDSIYAIGMMASGGSYCLGPGKSDSLVSAGQIALINSNQVFSGVPISGRRISLQSIFIVKAMLI